MPGDETPKLRFIRHSDIIPKSSLPTFERCTIASAFHRIPGLREWYISSDDDGFLVRPLNVSLLVQKAPDGVQKFAKRIDIHEPTLMNRELYWSMIGKGEGFMPRIVRNPASTSSGEKPYVMHPNDTATFKSAAFCGGAAYKNEVLISLDKTNPHMGSVTNPRRFIALHTNARDICPDVAFKAPSFIQSDYPCFKHGLVGDSALARVRNWLSALAEHPTAMWANIQGPGIDDCYGGQYFNKVNPIQRVFKEWAESFYTRATPFETYPLHFADQTTQEALLQLTKKGHSPLYRKWARG
jgi:hypothetical protein